MKVSLDWLQEYVSVDMSLEDLVDALTMLGLEVESATDRFSYLDNVLVGQINDLGKHPDFNSLSLCMVNCGEKSISIVCGAQNLTIGMMVPVAMNGTVMPNGFVVREKKIRGYLSSAMLCSEYDLGIGANNEGIMALDDFARIGSSIKSVLSISDFVLEIALTPNRPDCSSVIGIAREIAAIQDTELKHPFSSRPEMYGAVENHLSVNVVSVENCYCYMARIFTDLEVGPSPFWLQDRLISVGIKPVNNIVDITNFVMFETGQPLHAFDLDLLEGQRITVDTSKGGERIETLDGKEQILVEGILVVSDAKKPVAIAGVIGGLESRVSQKTKRILLESAYFDPICVRKASKALGISTESSYRFERGVDPNGTLKALNRAATMILELASGHIIGDIVYKNFMFYNSKVSIELDVDKTNCVLGTSLNSSQVSSLLTSVGFSIKSTEVGTLEVEVPSFRVDVARPEDLMEEVARLYGYNNIPITFPRLNLFEPKTIEFREYSDMVKSVLNGLGFSEVINYSFADIGSCDRLKLTNGDYRRRQVSIINPISSSQSLMRTSLLPALLDTSHRNISQQSKNLMIFETGKVFISNGDTELPDEVEMLTALCTGLRVESSWCDKEQYFDFFDIKGSLEEFFSFFGINDLKFTRQLNHICPYMRKGHTSQVLSSDICLGLVGELDSDVLGNYSIKQRVFAFEIEVDRFLRCLPKSKFVDPIPRFPSVSRDVTIIIDEEIESGHLLDKLRSLDESLVEDLYLLDVFRGASIKSGMKSISFRIIYRSHSTTLGDEAVNRLHKLLIDRLTNEFGALLPSSS